MIRRYVLPLIAAGMLVFAVAHAILIQRPDPKAPPPVSPPVSPFGETVAGEGMVEASTEASGTGNIAIGSQLAGAVTEVGVRMGQIVKAGDLLFQLDDRQARANLKLQQAALAAAQEQLRKLQLQPRPEEVPVTEKQVEVQESNLREMEDRFKRAKLVQETPGAMAEQDYVAALQGEKTALAQLDLAKASLALLKAGAWEPDKAIAAAAVEQAQAQVGQAQTMVDLLQVRAPVDGTILQVNVRPGEYVSTFGGQSLIVMGNLQPLHVRVSVDEEDLPRLRLDAPARAKIRGDTGQEEVRLSYVRLEPYIVPKISLTGSNTERVDTRVVQVIYAVDPNSHLLQEKKVLVGQLVDVFIDTRPTDQSDGSAAAASEPKPENGSNAR
jgi:HlyD family secretion protein